MRELGGWWRVLGWSKVGGRPWGGEGDDEVGTWMVKSR